MVEVDHHEVVQGVGAGHLVGHYLLQDLCATITHSYMYTLHRHYQQLSFAQLHVRTSALKKVPTDGCLSTTMRSNEQHIPFRGKGQF